MRLRRFAPVSERNALILAYIVQGASMNQLVREWGTSKPTLVRSFKALGIEPWPSISRVPTIAHFDRRGCMELSVARYHAQQVANIFKEPRAVFRRSTGSYCFASPAMVKLAQAAGSDVELVEVVEPQVKKGGGK